MRIGIIADIHEDIVSLKQAFFMLERAGCDEIICLGDIVGFKVTSYNYLDTRNAHECIAMVRANCKHVVIGNNDLYQIKKLPTFSEGFDFPKNWYTLDYFERKKIAKENVFLYEDVQLAALITKSDRAYLESLPEFLPVDIDNVKVLLSHFAYPDLLGVCTYFPKTAVEFEDHINFIKASGCTIGFSGHMHYEGVSICSATELKRNEFTECKLTEELQWVYGPCVARGRFTNGVMVWDTTAKTVEAMPLLKAQHSNTNTIPGVIANKFT